MRSFWKSAGPLAVGVLVALNVYVAQRQKAADSERAKAFPVAPPVNSASAPVRWDRSVGEHLDTYLPHIPDRSAHRLIALVGMSQMFTINDPAPGDRIIAEHLDDSLNGKGRVFGLAAPNLANEEATFILTTLLADARTKPHVFVFAACFDKLRNVDLRPTYATLLRRPEPRAQWTAIIERFGAKYPRATAKMAATIKAIEASTGGDDTLEAKFRAQVARFVPLVAARKSLNADAQSTLFLARNTILNIKPTSKRPVLRERYETNREFIELMEEISRANGIRFVTYVVPLNPQADNPYVKSEYEEFKAWLERFAASRDVPFANLEGIVPLEHWGQFMGGPDFKHFREEGHRITAAALLDRFGPILRGE